MPANPPAPHPPAPGPLPAVENGATGSSEPDAREAELWNENEEEDASKYADMLTGEDPSAPPEENMSRTAPKRSSPPVKPAVESPRVSIADKRVLDDGESTVTIELAVERVQSHARAIRQCYVDILANEPSAKGKVRLALTVDVTGKTIAIDVNGFNATMSGCIAKLARGWRFPIPRDKQGQPTTARFALLLWFLVA